jgi:hypothetical protein
MSVTFFAIIPPRLWQMSTIGLGSLCVRQHAFGCPKLIKTWSYFSVHINFFEQYSGIVLQSAVVFSNKNVGGVSICPDTRSRQTCGSRSRSQSVPSSCLQVSHGSPFNPWIAMKSTSNLSSFGSWSATRHQQVSKCATTPRGGQGEVLHLQCHVRSRRPTVI